MFSNICSKPIIKILFKTWYQLHKHKHKIKMEVKTAKCKFYAGSPLKWRSPSRATPKISPFLTGTAKGSLLDGEAIKLC